MTGKPSSLPTATDARSRLETRSEAFGYTFVLVQHLARRMDALLEPIGLTSRQWLLLAVLDKWFPGRDPSLSEAAARYGSSRQNVKQIALGLVARGFLRLEPDPADARTTRLHRTPRVAEFARPDAVAQSVEFLSAVFDGLTDDETDRLRELIARWLTALTTTKEGTPA